MIDCNWFTDGPNVIMSKLSQCLLVLNFLDPPVIPEDIQECISTRKLATVIAREFDLVQTA